jgi:uncharacterized hydrophobic protein (TIGR00271 family)
MKQYTIFYDSHQADVFESELKPLLEEYECDFIAYDSKSLPSLDENSGVLTWLADEDLYHLLPQAAQQQWQIGFLPHPEMKRAAKAFFVPKKMQDAITDCMAVETPASVDLMYCNEQLVLSSVMFGDPKIMAPAALIEESIWKKLKHFGSLAINLSKSQLSPYRLETAKETVINTAALGISVVYRPSDSDFTRRVVADTLQDESILNAVIFAPRSIVEVVRFLFASIFAQKPSNNTSLPDHLGLIKTEKLTISGSTVLDYSIDGSHLSAEQIEVVIKEDALLVLSSEFPEKLSRQDQKESVRVTGLPKGQAVKELINRSFPWIHHADQDELKEIFTVLKDNSRSTESYLVLMILATLLATIGLFANSAPVIIGAMILAPLMAPIISLSMGVVRQNGQLVTMSSKTLFIGVSVALLFGTLLTLIIPLQTINHEIGARLSPTILDLGVAIISGIAGAYANARSEVIKSLAGVAIAVALVPPLAVSGLGIGWLDWQVFSGAFLLFTTNLVGMVLAASMTFLVMGFSPFHIAKKGMILSTLFVLVVSIPLVLAFTTMVEEQRIVHTLEGWKTNGIEIKDVKIRSGTPIYVSVKLLSDISLQTEQIDQVKQQMESLLGQNIRLEATTAVVR